MRRAICLLALLSTSLPALVAAEPTTPPETPAKAKTAPAVATGNAAPAAAPIPARSDFDWSEWQALPVQHDGRIKPLDSLADEIVTLVTGRSKWSDPDAPKLGTYLAPELLFCWITRPDAWLDRPILRCEYRPLRKILNTPQSPVPEERTFISLGQILDWKRSTNEGHSVFWSKDLEERLAALDKQQGKAPNTIGETAADQVINGKVAELFHHVQAFLNVRQGNDVFIVPGLDPRALSKQTNPKLVINAWVSLGAILAPEKWKNEDDLTMAALMADSPRELANDLLSRRYPEKHPSHPRNIVPILPQLAQAQKLKGVLQPEIRAVKEALDHARDAYEAGEAPAFASSMHAFVEQIRRLAHSLETARAEMAPPDKKAAGAPDFGDVDGMNLNDLIWGRYEPLPLSEAQMRFSAYPAPGSTQMELVYNKYQPFRTAWIIFLLALVVIILSTMLKSPRTLYAAGLAITAAAIAYSAWGFAMRIIIAQRPPVTNMFETIIWSSFVVSILGLWFCLIPFTWPGLSWAWRLSGIPLAIRRSPSSRLPRVELDRAVPEDRGRFLADARLPIQCGTSVVRLALFTAMFWFFTRSDTSFRIVALSPPIFGKAIAWSSLGTWLVGISTVGVCSWFASRTAVTLALSVFTFLPEGARNSTRMWEQTYQRRYFLLGALPVACFGMMLAYFVGNISPDILNPRIGSITAVLRNTYWLTIHVLTIVSSYGAGGLAWGLGNLAMLYYLFGKYRRETSTSLAYATADGDGPLALEGEHGPGQQDPGQHEASEHDPRDPSIGRRLKTAAQALHPSLLPQTLKASLQDFGTGDQHLERARVLPPKEVATLASYTYKAQQVAVLLLAAGTILGGLWADVSWGRFWDWDPKEVWALISLLAYLVVLHGRFAGWVGTFGTNAGGVLAFSAILFSWYGVNFVLPMIHGWLNGTNMPTEVGLHAYAVGSGGLAYVVGGVLLNLILVTAAWARYTGETTPLLRRPKPTATLQAAGERT